MSALDEGRLAEVEAAARAATPGPWIAAEQTHGEWFGIQSRAFALGTEFDAGDAAHIAAASPDVVLALVAEVREARGDLIRVRDMADDVCDCGSMAGRFGAHDPRCPTALLRDALRGPVAASGSQDEPVDPSGPNGVQIGRQSRDVPPVPMPTWDRNGPTGEAMP